VIEQDAVPLLDVVSQRIPGLEVADAVPLCHTVPEKVFIRICGGF
jgi:hypothetical protein